jgi:hypothetical protein
MARLTPGRACRVQVVADSGQIDNIAAEHVRERGLAAKVLFACRIQLSAKCTRDSDDAELDRRIASYYAVQAG